MADIKYLSVEQVINIHKQILEGTPEDKNRSPDKSIDSAINRIHDYVYYDGLNDLFKMAALYGVAIAKGHCFNNGNKRTGMVSMVVFLEINGIQLSACDQQIEDIMIDIVENKITQDGLADWLRSYAYE